MTNGIFKKADLKKNNDALEKMPSFIQPTTTEPTGIYPKQRLNQDSDEWFLFKINYTYSPELKDDP